MYVPAYELQQYKGQWTCPVCLGDMRSEDREKVATLDAIGEKCSRCGTSPPMIYVYNGRRLCQTCFEQAKTDDTDFKSRKPPKGGAKVLIVDRGVGKIVDLLEDAIIIFFRFFGVKLEKRPKKSANISEVVAVRKTKREKDPMINRAKTMEEGLEIMQDSQNAPLSEGINKKKTPARKKKDS